MDDLYDSQAKVFRSSQGAIKIMHYEERGKLLFEVWLLSPGEIFIKYFDIHTPCDYIMDIHNFMSWAGDGHADECKIWDYGL